MNEINNQDCYKMDTMKTSLSRAGFECAKGAQVPPASDFTALNTALNAALRLKAQPTTDLV